MDADGTNLRHVPNCGFARDPRGRRTAGTSSSRRSRRMGRRRIYSVNVDGSELTELARGREETIRRGHRDGAEIAFRSNRITRPTWLSGYPLIYKMNADGTAQTRLTRCRGGGGIPQLVPDGSRIAFHSDRVPHEGGSKILAIDADGSNVTRLTSGGLAGSTGGRPGPPTARESPTAPRAAMRDGASGR